MSRAFRQVYDQFDWEGYIREHFAVKNTASEELRVCCFQCDETKFKLYVNPVKGVWTCFKCGFSTRDYDVFDFVALAEDITRGQAMTKLIREYGAITPSDEELGDILSRYGEIDHYESLFDTDIKTLSLPPQAMLLSQRDDKTTKFWDYLINRGLTESEIVAIQAHYIVQEPCDVFDSKGKRRGDISNRVIIPVYGGDHELVSWQGRSILPDTDMKYLTAPESEMAKTFWPYVLPFDKHAVLVEGIYDCLAVRRVPNVSVYATFSKKVSISQMLLLKRWGIENITLFWDKRDAKKEIIQAVPELHMHFKKVYVSNMTEWPIAQDAGDMLKDAQGAEKLKSALSDLVDTYDSLAYARWQLEF